MEEIKNKLAKYNISFEEYKKSSSLIGIFKVPNILKTLNPKIKEQEAFYNVAWGVFLAADSLTKNKASLQEQNDYEEWKMIVSDFRAQKFQSAIFEEIKTRCLSNSFPEIQNQQLFPTNLSQTGKSIDYSNKYQLLSPLATSLIINSRWENLEINPDKIKINISEVYASKFELNDKLAEKANWIDTYRKSDIEEKMNLKANIGISYTKNETEQLLNEKSNKLETYTKTETEKLLSQKLNKSSSFTKEEIINKLEAKSDKENVYTKNEIENRLNLKSDSGTSYTKSEADERFLLEHQDVSNLATKEELSSKVNQTDFIEKIQQIKSTIEPRWNIPEINTLEITRSRRHSSNLVYDITFNHFDTKEKIIYWLQYLKTLNSKERNKWAVKVSDLFDGVRISNQNYTGFWKIILYESSSDPNPSETNPQLGGYGPNDNNTTTPRSNQIMTDSWKFYDKNAVRLSLLYLINKYPWTRSENNIFYEVINLPNITFSRGENYDDTEIRALINEKSNSENVYSKEEIANKLAQKADVGSTYIKSEIDSKYATKIELNNKSNIGVSYTKSETDSKYATSRELSNKQNKLQNSSGNKLINVSSSGAVNYYNPNNLFYSKSETDSKYATKLELANKIRNIRESYRFYSTGESVSFNLPRFADDSVLAGYSIVYPATPSLTTNENIFEIIDDWILTISIPWSNNVANPNRWLTFNFKVNKFGDNVEGLGDKWETKNITNMWWDGGENLILTIFVNPESSSIKVSQLINKLYDGSGKYSEGINNAKFKWTAKIKRTELVR